MQVRKACIPIVSCCCCSKEGEGLGGTQLRGKRAQPCGEEVQDGGRPLIGIENAKTIPKILGLEVDSWTRTTRGHRRRRGHIPSDGRGPVHRMQKDKPLIGLSWKPKINIPSAQISSSKNPEAPQKSLWLPESKLVDGLFVPPSDPKKVNKLIRKSRKDTAGTHWFDMPAPTITSEIQKDLEIIKLRGTIDPKRHYKKAGSRKKDLPKYFQMGTVIESSTDYYSGRLTKQERKATIADELLSDEKFNSYRKRKVREIGEARRPGGKEKWKIRGKAKKPPSKKKKAIL